MIRATVRESLAVRAIATFASRLRLRDPVVIASVRRRNGAAAYHAGRARPDCRDAAAGWDEAHRYMAMRGCGRAS